MTNAETMTNTTPTNDTPSGDTSVTDAQVAIAEPIQPIDEAVLADLSDVRWELVVRIQDRRPPHAQRPLLSQFALSPIP